MVERDGVGGGQQLVGAHSGGAPVVLHSIAVASDPGAAVLADTHLVGVSRLLEPEHTRSMTKT